MKSLSRFAIVLNDDTYHQTTQYTKIGEIMGRIIAFIYGIISYVLFLGSFGYAIAFLGPDGKNQSSNGIYKSFN